MATRQASGQVLNAIAQRIPWLIGGAADLAPSTRTLIKDGGDLEADNAGARNLHFGIREHAMGTILNGLAHQHLRPFGASFLIFSDYMRPPIRLASLMDLPVVYVFTHDSISLGEDGPTHQSIEQLASLRAVPGLTVIRPADANETSEALRAALSLGRPVVLALTRQPLPVLDRSDLAPASELCRGAYVLAEADGGPPELLLLASGSEVALCLEARRRLSSEGIRARVVSMPSWELFEEQEPGYHDRVLPPDVRVRIAVEEGSPLGWDRYTGADGCILGISTFGASAPYRDVERKFGFTAQNVAHLASEQLSRYWKGIRPSTAQRAGAGPEDRAAHRHAGAEIAP
jgi:transketolase